MIPLVPRKIILLLSLPLAVLVVIVSCVGLFTQNFYSAETPNWQAQSLGQDMVDLFLVTPCLLVTSFLGYRGNRAAKLCWGGVVLYLTYTFILYCFDVHFNKLFPLYCLSLGLSFYALILFLADIHLQKDVAVNSKSINRVTAIYFIVIATLFYFLWLGEVIPAAIGGTVPKSVLEAGLFTNGVQVLDLAIVLPAILLTGISIFRKASFAYSFAPAVLSFFVLMDLTIASLTIAMKLRGIVDDLVLPVIMVGLAAISLILLIVNLKNMRTASS